MTPEERAERRRDGERGAVTVFVVAFAVTLLILAGLVVDGGMAINARQRVSDDVEQAARAGSQNLNLVTLRDQGLVRIDPGPAEDAAARFMQVRGYTGTDVHIKASDRDVIVDATYRQHTALLSLISIDSFTVHATGRAVPAVGITGRDIAP
jgi:Flp pilus assembly protein TadG